MEGVNSEYGRLKKVLVGRADGFRLPALEHDPLICERTIGSEYKLLGEPYPEKVIKEANQSLDNLSNILKENGVEVVRPPIGLPDKRNHCSEAGNRGYSTRDVMIVIEDILYLTPTCHQSRATEPESCFREIIDMYSDRNKLVDLRSDKWKNIAADKTRNFMYNDNKIEKEYLTEIKKKLLSLSIDIDIAAVKNLDSNNKILTNEVPIFDAANLLFINKSTILYLVSCSANWNGFVTFSEIMFKNHNIKVVPIPSSIYSGTHLDSTLCVLNNKYILFCEERISRKQVYELCGIYGYPDINNNYIGVTKEDIYDVGLFRDDQNFASIYIGMNLLALTPDILIVEEKQINLISKLKKFGFKILTVAYPHMRSMGGGIHCTTLPLVRELI